MAMRSGTAAARAAVPALAVLLLLGAGSCRNGIALLGDGDHDVAPPTDADGGAEADGGARADGADTDADGEADAGDDAGAEGDAEVGSEADVCELAGCVDGCCGSENGGTETWGGCWTTCEDEPVCNPTIDSCETAWFLPPGETAWRDPDMWCYGYSGLNSFWYTGPLAAALAEEYADPTCPADDPCCQERRYELGFDVTTAGCSAFVPLDTSDVPGLGWSCRGTNCGSSCDPPVGTTVAVHVAWNPPISGYRSVTCPDTFNLLDVCPPP